MSKPKDLIFPLLLIVAGYLFLSPHLVYQQDIAQGDHGRDLYSFEAVYRGEIPYRDFWWVYGPAMPYYYGIFYKLLGVNVSSVLIGKTLLTIFSGIFVYLSLSLFIAPLFAVAGAFWFWAYFPDFYFTYNHAGGIMLLLAMAYTLFLYLKSQDTKYLFRGLACIFLLSMVKINFGFSSLASYLVSVHWIDKINRTAPTAEKERFYTVGLKIFPFVILGIYILLVWGLPFAERWQCFPYFPAPSYQTPFEKWFKEWPKTIFANIHAQWPHKLLGSLIISSVLWIIYLIRTNKILLEQRRHLITAAKILVVLYFFQLHEYMNGATTEYRLYWAKPFSLLLSFIFIGTAAQSYWPAIRWLILGALFSAAFINFQGETKKIASPGFYNNFWLVPRMQVVLPGNGEEWVKTVQSTTVYLENHLKSDETFFTLPYDPLYYYLMGRKTPTRQLIFFEHMNIPPEQEKRVIAELERNRVNYIVMSNRSKSNEEGCGTLGETYCPLLGKYIAANFETVETYGEWNKSPLWAWNHGTKILKRIK